MKKFRRILFNALPILLMIGLIPLVQNDYMLAALDLVIAAASLIVKRERGEIGIFIFGFCVMIACEYLFVNTGVETFTRNTLFGLMPLWLPILWGYGFIAIKRGSEILVQ